MIEIRRATSADTDVMQRLWDEFCVEATFTPYPGNPFEPALLTDHVALVAEDDGEAVGTVYANLSSLYTIPAARRRGIGLGLMRAIAAVIRDEGRQHVVLTVDTPNEQARAFYDRLGFVDHARTLRAGVDDLLGG